jgi:hypothetical protein
MSKIGIIHKKGKKTLILQYRRIYSIGNIFLGYPRKVGQKYLN